jgi:signal transduction histidine kinase
MDETFKAPSNSPKPFQAAFDRLEAFKVAAMTTTPETLQKTLHDLLNEHAALLNEATRLTAISNVMQQQLQKTEADLHEMTNALKLANQLKTEFLTIAAHDLKNPLQIILGFTELLRASPTDSHLVEHLAGKVEASSQQMLQLILNLLQTAASEKGTIQLSKRLCDIATVTATVINQNHFLADRKSQIIHFTADSGCVVDIDPDRIGEAIDNLLSNAIKYSPPQKSIFINVRKLAKTVQVEVRDEGPGILDAEIPRLFKQFQRLGSRPTAGESSTGLGLFIVQQIAALHGGKVWVTSEGEGTGSTFILELPLFTAT